MGLIRFDDVFEKEIGEAVSARRKRYHRDWHAPDKPRDGKNLAEWRVGKPPPYDPEPQSEPALEPEGKDADGHPIEDADGHPIKCPTEKTELIGLALSGGGVRSAAFCLGALQALHEQKILSRVDYLSTVSGGGYIGTSMTAAMSVSRKADFPFPSTMEPEEDPAIRHVRDHSNYLFPRGLSDLVGNMGIYLRGLMANAILLLPWLLLAALITIALYPWPKVLQPHWLHLHSTVSHWAKLPHLIVSHYWPQPHPHWTVPRIFELKWFALWFAILLAVWGVQRSTWGAGQADVHSFPTWLARWGLIVLCIIAWCALQPVIIQAILANGPPTQGMIGRFLSGLLSEAPKILAAFGALVGIFSTLFAEVLKRDRVVSSTRRGRVVPFLAAAAVYIAAATVPLLLWIAYFYLSIWGICTPELQTCSGIPADGLGALADANTETGGPATGLNAPAVANPATGTVTPEWLIQLANNNPAPHIFHWLKLHIFDWLKLHIFDWLKVHIFDWLKVHIFDWLNVHIFAWLKPHILYWLNVKAPIGALYTTQIEQLYASVFIVLVVLQLLLRPNANSLHRLYRDRLSKAFLFRRGEYSEHERASPRQRTPGFDVVKTLKPLDEPKFNFSQMADDYGPYQIINAALNIRGSKYANQRGRDADFFVFTSKYIGSRATHYVPTMSVEAKVPDLDLAAAMAISGAAASSNMGSNTIKALAPTLAILNIRLGFWLPNPRVIADARRKSVVAKLKGQLYFLAEMLGWLTEDSDLIYLTDGGHIENLGIYELLRRRCALIIAVDAEADPGMNFNSLIALQRHALIDLGVRINLPWSTIRDATRAAGDAVTETRGVNRGNAKHGPHVALGTIEYPKVGKIDYPKEGRKGVLLYIKSSLSGDENDCIIDYKRRNERFPHETTADQFFTEEQFEVYRALGFHATYRALSGEDDIAMTGESLAWSGPNLDIDAIKGARRLLFGEANEKIRPVAPAKAPPTEAPPTEAAPTEAAPAKPTAEKKRGGRKGGANGKRASTSTSTTSSTDPSKSEPV